MCAGLELGVCVLGVCVLGLSPLPINTDELLTPLYHQDSGAHEEKRETERARERERERERGKDIRMK